MNERSSLVIAILALFAGLGFGIVWLVRQVLSDESIRLLIGGCVVLVVVLAVGAMFVMWSVSQSRLRRQELQQDDLDELKKMALILRMSGGRMPTINVKTPDTPQLSAPMMWPYPVQQEQGQPLDGEYRDSINLE